MPRILIADDADIGRAILKNLLKKDYEVVEARNGLEVIRILQADSSGIDAIVLDLMMPVMNGLQVLGWLRENGILARTPVLMLTAISDPSGIAGCVDAGACDVIEKPYDPVVLQAKIRAAIRRREDIRSAAMEDAEKTIDGVSPGGDGGFSDAVLDAIPVPVFAINARSRKISYANAAFRALPGMVANPIGMTHSDLLRQQDAVAVAEAEDELLRYHRQRPVFTRGLDGHNYVVMLNALLDEAGSVDTIIGCFARTYSEEAQTSRI